MGPLRKSRSKVVCECLKVTRADVVSAIRRGAGTLGDLKDKTGAGSGCTACHPALCELLHRIPKPKS